MEHKKTVLLATRPLIPPWDEASKNFAYFLGKEVKRHSLTLLTAHTPLEGVSESVHQEPIFSQGHFGLRAKWELVSYLRRVRSAFDITHYLFTPTKLNTNFIKWFAQPRGKTLQTVATLRDDLYGKETLRSILFADQLVTYTDQTKEKLERLGFTNVTRIYPGIDLDRYQPRPKDESTLEKLGFNTNHFIVVYPGEYVRLGATDMLTDCFLEFFKNHPTTNLRFVFACRVKNDADAKKKALVQKRFAEANLLSFVSFSDTISDMAALYNTSDIVIFPVSNLKGKFDVPLIIIEAYACGKSVILSDLPQFREFANERICVTISKDSSSELIGKIAYLKDNPAIREALGHEARLYAEAHFDLRNTARQYEAIYDSL